MMKKTLFSILLLSTLILTRFLYLDHTARFTRDESSDLARMHAYWAVKKITLVGPISNDNVKVFSSLTYYMQMPFAAAYNFKPVGPVVGTAFWGVLTVLLVIFLGIRDRGKAFSNSSLLLFSLLAILWTPLLVTSRWAWNPHLVPFWIALALFLRRINWKWKYLLVGLSFGLSLHNHYIAIFAVGTFGLIESIFLLNKKRWFDLLLLAIGFGLAILPFILFDLRHPPGLFITSYFQAGAPNVVAGPDVSLSSNLLRNFAFALKETVGLIWLQVFFVLMLFVLLFEDFKHSKRHFMFIVPVIAQIIGPIIIDGYHQRYFLPATVFLLVWLIQPRKNNGNRAALYLIIIILIGSVLRLPAVFSSPEQVAPMSAVTEAGDGIVSIMHDNFVKNPNIAVITGADLDSLGEKYRDLLSIDGISFRAASEYDASENLFVISTEDEESIRGDQNVSMQLFRDSRLIEVKELADKPWKLYWFGI